MVICANRPLPIPLDEFQMTLVCRLSLWLDASRGEEMYFLKVN